MAKPGSGDCTSGNPNYASDNLGITLKTILKNQQSLSHKEQPTFARHWTRPSPSLQATSEQILTPVQQTAKPLLKQARGFCNGNLECVSLLGIKNSYPVSWENSVQKNAGQNSCQAYSKCTPASRQDVCFPNVNYSQTFVGQKAVAVVAPLAPEVVDPVTFPKSSVKTNKRDIETSLPDKQDPHRHSTCTSQSRKYETILEFLCGNAAQSHPISQELPSKPMLPTGGSLLSEPKGPVHAQDLSVQSENVYSGSVSCTSMERKESVHSKHVEDQCISDDPSAKNISYNDSNTRLESTDRWANFPITKWSLQKLRSLMYISELRQKKSQKVNPVTDISSEILKLYWNGDYEKLCNAARSDYYINIMKEVKRHCGKENSVIIHEISKEKLNELAEDFYILKDNLALSAGNKQSFECDDAKKKHDTSSSLMTFSNTATLVGEVIGQRQKTLQVAENEKTEASFEDSSRTVVFPQAQSKSLPTDQRNCVSGGDGVVEKLVNMDTESKGHHSITENAEQKQPLFESKGLSTMTVEDCKNVNVNRTVSGELVKAEGKNQTSLRTEMPLMEPINKESPAVNNSTHTNGNQLKPSITNMTLPFDNCDDDCTNSSAFAEKKTLSQVTTKILSAGKVEDIEKGATVHSFMENQDQVIYSSVKPPEGEELMDSDMKRGEKNRSHSTAPTERFCCVDKWFQVLGYANNGLCKCVKTELSPGNSSTGLMEETSLTVIKLEPPPVLADADMEDLEIVEIVSNYHDVLKVANAIADQVPDEPLAEPGTLAFKKKRKHGFDAGSEKCKKQTSCDEFASKVDVTAKFQKVERVEHLALFGASAREHNKTIPEMYVKKRIRSGVRSFDQEFFPPATITVRLSPLFIENTSSNRKQTAKQSILNLWTNSFVPIKASTNGKQSKKYTKRTRSTIDAADTSTNAVKTFPTAFGTMRTLSYQEHIKICRSKSTEPEMSSSVDQQKNLAGKRKKKKYSTRRDIIQNKLKKRIKASMSSAITKNSYKKYKSMESSFELLHTSNKSTYESHKGIALNFGVLPKSFNFTDHNATMEVDQSLNTECGQRVQAEKLKKLRVGNTNVWHLSPKKKGHLKSTSDIPGPSNMFQEFKRKYEEKKQRSLLKPA